MDWKLIDKYDTYEEADHDRRKLAKKKKNWEVQVNKKANGKFHVRMRLKPTVARKRT